jgi:hypothetical protein
MMVVATLSVSTDACITVDRPPLTQDIRELAVSLWDDRSATANLWDDREL